MIDEYANKLKDARWKDRAAQIRIRDCSICRVCGQMGFDVHHLYYDKGKEPWDYPDTALVTLCRPCHDSEEKNLRTAYADLISLRKIPMMSNQIDELISILGVNGIAGGDYPIEHMQQLLKIMNKIKNLSSDGLFRFDEVFERWENELNGY